jgi:hypothetical protein
LGLGNLALFSAGGGFSHCRSFGAAGCLHTLGGSGPRCLFGFAQGLLRGRVGGNSLL